MTKAGNSAFRLILLPVKAVGWVVGLLSRAAVLVITALLKTWHYAFAPWFGVRCRFEPTCSEYSVEAYCRHGFFRGSALTLFRVVRCHPFCEGGEDPVPEKPQCRRAAL